MQLKFAVLYIHIHVMRLVVTYCVTRLLYSVGLHLYHVLGHDLLSHMFVYSVGLEQLYQQYIIHAL